MPFLSTRLGSGASSGARDRLSPKLSTACLVVRRATKAVGIRDTGPGLLTPAAPFTRVQQCTPPKPPRCFQDVILTLQTYWAEQGCAILQPYDEQVGAGTLHPATTLRSLGPKPWRAAYVQPSRRPKDGRYGENPNRLQHYYQFQVILKPNPPDLQQLYLNSLAAIGIDPLLHDIRFVEDDWENPTVGAWGLGLGSVVRRHGGEPVHLFPASRRPGCAPGERAN